MTNMHSRENQIRLDSLSHEQSCRETLRHGPLAAMFHVAQATSPAAAELAREFIAASDAVHQATRAALADTMLAGIFDNGLSREELKRLANEQPSAQVLFGQLQMSFEVLRRHSPEDVHHYRVLVLKAAEHAANALKETRYFSRSRVTAAERRAIEEIRIASEMQPAN